MKSKKRAIRRHHKKRLFKNLVRKDPANLRRSIQIGNVPPEALEETYRKVVCSGARWWYRCTCDSCHPKKQARIAKETKEEFKREVEDYRDPDKSWRYSNDRFTSLQ